jgi:hypothetical protein
MHDKAALGRLCLFLGHDQPPSPGRTTAPTFVSFGNSRFCTTLMKPAQS